MAEPAKEEHTRTQLWCVAPADTIAAPSLAWETTPARGERWRSRDQSRPGAQTPNEETTEDMRRDREKEMDRS